MLDRAVEKLAGNIAGSTYRSHQGKYPVIFLTFKDVKFDSWSVTLDKIREVLQTEFGRRQMLLDSEQLVIRRRLLENIPKRTSIGRFLFM